MFKSKKHKEWSLEGSYQSQLLTEYLDFLCNHRGLAKNTVRFRRDDIISFLKSLRLQNDLEDIGKISVKEIHEYVIKMVKLMKRPSRRHLVASIRSFLKFCLLKGYVNRDLTESKWGNPLCLPLYPEIADALLAYIRETRGKAPYPEVFLTVNKPRPLDNGGALSSSLKTCFRNAGIAASTHAIRHAFATRLMEHDTPIKTIADLLGHKTISTAFIYLPLLLKRTEDSEQNTAMTKNPVHPSL